MGKKSVLEGFGGEAEGFLEWKECVDEEDALAFERRVLRVRSSASAISLLAVALRAEYP